MKREGENAYERQSDKYFLEAISKPEGCKNMGPMKGLQKEQSVYDKNSGYDDVTENTKEVPERTW